MDKHIRKQYDGKFNHKDESKVNNDIHEYDRMCSCQNCGLMRMDFSKLEERVAAHMTVEGTKLWALNQLHNGKKITHTSFTSEEYLKNGSIRDIEFEDGCQCSFDEFWHYRKEDVWQDGWSIYD